MATGRDPDGTFDTPRFEETMFGGGTVEKGESGKSKEDGFFVN
jgi:xylulose-5-phosphate/fructose-6-phosphate phosphoketolase